MSVLYVGTQGAELHLRGDRIEVRRDDALVAFARVPLLESVVLSGRVSITPAVIDRLLQEGIDCVFLSAQGRFKGRLESLNSTAATLRVAQARAAGSPDACLAIARHTVRAKIESEARVLRALRVSPPPGLATAARTASEADTLAGLRGAEGYAGRTYFDGLRRSGNLSHGWTRDRQGGGLNAMLNYGYAILQAEVHAAVCTLGLEPWIGFLHEAGRPRPALVLDLMEEFRAPLVDFTALRVVREIRWDGRCDFDAGKARLPDPVRVAIAAALLGRLGRSTYDRRRHQRLTLRRLIHERGRELARLIAASEGAMRGLRP